MLVAVQGHQGSRTECHGLGAQSQTLGHVTAVADPAGHHEVDLVGQAHVLERPSGLGDGGHQRDARLLGGEVRTSTGTTFGAIEVDRVRTALGGHPNIVVHP